ncbi:hypothetical protein AHAS_Ahas17G0240700 [Arachis hypogaea]
MVNLENDFSIPIERLISKKIMEQTREYARVPRRGQAREEAQQAPPPPLMPQGHYFLPQEYWQQLTSFLEQMRVTQDSHGILLHQIVAE